MMLMLTLPSSLYVSLVHQTGDWLRLPDVLVTIRFFVDGQYYYGGSMALTGETGVASFDRGDVEADFEYNRRLFPMDYRLPLTECDPEAEVAVLGGSEFIRAREAATSSPLLLPKFEAMWRRARNEPLASAAARVLLEDVQGRSTQTVGLQMQ